MSSYNFRGQGCASWKLSSADGGGSGAEAPGRKMAPSGSARPANRALSSNTRRARATVASASLAGPRPVPHVLRADRAAPHMPHGGHTQPSQLPHLDLHPERAFVSELVSNNEIVIFSKTTCPHCDATKSLLHNKGVDFKTVELDQLTAGASVQNVLQEMTQARTVPRIFIGGQCVGGNSDLRSLNATGKLDCLLMGGQMY